MSDHAVSSRNADTIRKALGLLSSAVKSGEDWSGQCERIKAKALAALDALLAELDAATKRVYEFQEVAEDYAGQHQRAEAEAERYRKAQKALESSQPVEVDISDFSDEWCAGFIRGQQNAADFLSRVALQEETP